MSIICKTNLLNIVNLWRDNNYQIQMKVLYRFTLMHLNKAYILLLFLCFLPFLRFSFLYSKQCLKSLHKSRSEPNLQVTCQWHDGGLKHRGSWEHWRVEDMHLNADHHEFLPWESKRSAAHIRAFTLWHELQPDFLQI